MEGSQRVSVHAEDLNRAIVLLQVLTEPLVNKDRFRVIVEKTAESDRVRIEYLF